MGPLAALLDDWEAMSEHFLPGRGALLIEATDWLRGQDPAARIVELGSGPGTTLRRLRGDLPEAQLVGIDNDPVLRRLHDLATPSSASIDVLDADLAEPSWTEGVLQHARPTVVLAVQVLHYLAPPRFDAVLAEVRRLLEAGGVLVHLDHVPIPGVEAAAEQPTGRVDPWSRWWDAAAEFPMLADAFETRRLMARSGAGSAEYHPAEPTLDDHFSRAGLRDVVRRERHGSSLLTIAAAG